jgi:serine protease AprX
MDRVKRLIHAQNGEIWPYDGSGITAAVLDTGIAMHPDFADRVIGFKDFVGTSRLPYDDCGHGTHVTGCLCGSGFCSKGRFSGVASGCRILAGKVLDEKGDGTILGMIEGMEWILKNRALYQVKILNISISMGEVENVALMQRLISCLDRAWDDGIFVVVAAGNRGPASRSLSHLGESSKVVTVGCHDGLDWRGKEHSCELYSGRGPAGTSLKKPDIVAPGTDITSCNAWFRNTPRGYKDPYTVKNGTSMSTPLVAGAAALCFQKYPWYTNEQVKRRILRTATDLDEPWSKQGWGMLNVARMLGMTRRAVR